MAKKSIVRQQAGHIAGKLRRRKAILAAAERIVAVEGEAGLTMRAIAAKAGVALVTPYNLFGSKQEILQTLCQEQLESFFAAFPSGHTARGAGKLFDLIDLTYELWASDPKFYRSLMEILYGKTGLAIGPGVWGPRLVFVQTLLAEAVTAGDLHPRTPTHTLSRNLLRLSKAVTQEWIDGLSSLANAHRTTAVGFIMLISGFATDRFAAKLKAIKDRYDFGSDPPIT